MDIYKYIMIIFIISKLFSIFKFFHFRDANQSVKNDEFEKNFTINDLQFN
jgi:hypothetical protein